MVGEEEGCDDSEQQKVGVEVIAAIVPLCHQHEWILNHANCTDDDVDEPKKNPVILEPKVLQP